MSSVYVLIQHSVSCYCGPSERTVIGVVESEEAAKLWEQGDRYDRDYEEFTLNDLPT